VKKQKGKRGIREAKQNKEPRRKTEVMTSWEEDYSEGRKSHGQWNKWTGM